MCRRQTGRRDASRLDELSQAVENIEKQTNTAMQSYKLALAEVEKCNLHQALRLAENTVLLGRGLLPQHYREAGQLYLHLAADLLGPEAAMQKARELGIEAADEPPKSQKTTKK